METSLILGPILAQVGLTLVVLMWLPTRRLPAIYRAKIKLESLQRMGGSEFMEKAPPSTHFPSDNYKNLFEAPLLFFALCLTAHAMNYADDIFLNMAWVYVFFRSIHTLIHCTYNRVSHRFVSFVLSCIVLIAMYIRILLAYLT